MPISDKNKIIEKADFNNKIINNESVKLVDSLKLKNEITQSIESPKNLDSVEIKHPLSILTNSTVKTAEKVVENAENKEEEQVKKPLPLIRPIKIAGYEVGFTGGVAFIGDGGISRQTGFSTGIKAGVLLSEQFRLIAEGQYVGLGLSIRKNQ